MKHTIEALRAALQKMHRQAGWGESVVCVSIPAEFLRGADLILSDALEELELFRQLVGARAGGGPTVTFDDYQSAAWRTAPTQATIPLQAIFALGLAGESGEVVELIKKHYGHGKALDKIQLAGELGDVLWYLSALASTSGLSLSSIAEYNVTKLKQRYPDGFVRADGGK